MKTVLKMVLSAALCSALVFCALTSAFAAGTPEPRVEGETIIDARTGGEASTNFKVIAYSDFAILSATENFTMNVGSSSTLMVDVKGRAPITYTWEVSTDGGTTWSPASGTTSQSTYQITNAQVNDPAQQPYIYRVTVDDAGSVPPISKEITVLVSNDYKYKTIELLNGNTDVSAYMHEETRLVVTPLPDSVPVADVLAEELNPDCLPLLICDVSLVNQNDQVVPYFGALQVSFHVGSEYDGETLRALHLHDNDVTVYTGVVTDGKLTITVNALSPFMIEVPEVGTHAVAASASAGGSIAPSGTVNVADGTDKTFTFLPESGYVVDHVTLDGNPVSVTGNSYKLENITQDHTVTVSFRHITPSETLRTVTINSPAHGSVNPSGTIQVRHGAAQTIYFYPSDGYELDTVSINGAQVNVIGNSFTLSAVEGDTEVRATFRPGTTQRPNVHKAITPSAGTGGSISPLSEVNVEYGGELYYYFIPDDGYEVDKVTVDGAVVSVSNNSYHFINVVDKHTINVTFKRIVTPQPPSPPSSSSSPATRYYTITTGSGSHGSISPEGRFLVAEGHLHTLYFIPDEGYEVDTVTVDGMLTNVSGWFLRLANITSNHTVRVTFKKAATPPDAVKHYTLAAGSGENGSISPAGTVKIAEGHDACFHFIPNNGYEIDTVTVDGKAVATEDNSYCFNDVGADHAIHVTFKKAEAAPEPILYHTISVSAEGKGSISPSGDVLVPHEGSQSFYLIAEDGYEVKAIYVNEKKQDVVGSRFTIEKVTDDVELFAAFKPISMPASSGAYHCLICGWFGHDIAPWCYLAPLLVAGALAVSCYFVVTKRSKNNS